MDTSPQVQKDAVALLMYHLGIASEMEYSCTGSGSYAWSDDVLDNYFGYGGSMHRYQRGAYTAGQWFALFKNEFNADPPRPVILSISTLTLGHKVVADGYQNDGTDFVHINFGWEGSWDNFYNITDDFPTGDLTWVANSQVIVTNIQPNNAPPDVNAGVDQSVEKAMQVQLYGIATDPENVGIRSYLWTQIGGPVVNLSDRSSPTPTFIAPFVSTATELVFQLRADDVNRAFATDTVNVTVNPLDRFTIAAESIANGTINLDPPGGIYKQGTSVTITAVPGTDFRFHHWLGDVLANSNPFNIIMTRDLSITAAFAPQAGDCATLFTSGGQLLALTVDEGQVTLQESSIAIPLHLDFIYPPLDFTITDISVGSITNCVLYLPAPASEEAQMFKYIDGSWVDVDYGCQYFHQRTSIVFGVIDGAWADDDHSANGQIRDPIGLAITLNSPLDDSTDPSNDEDG